MGDRQRYQHRVQSLLEEIEGRRRQQARLAAYGVTAAGMRALEHELRGIRDELAVVIAAGSS